MKKKFLLLIVADRHEWPDDPAWTTPGALKAQEILINKDGEQRAKIFEFETYELERPELVGLGLAAIEGWRVEDCSYAWCQNAE